MGKISVVEKTAVVKPEKGELNQTRKCVVSRAYHQARNAAVKRGLLQDTARIEGQVAAKRAGEQWDAERA